MTRKLTLFAALALFIPACAAGPNKGPTVRPSAPAITDLRVNLVDEYQQQKYLLGYDFLLLKVAVSNPETMPVAGEITCQSEGTGGLPPITHQFSVDPQSRQQFTVPLSDAPEVTYRLRCRLQYSDDSLGAVRSPSPWVTTLVRAKDEA